MLKFLSRIAKFRKRKYFKPLEFKIIEADLEILNRYNLSSHKMHSTKAKALLMANKGFCIYDIVIATGASTSSIFRWINAYNKIGLKFIVTKVTPEKRAEMWEERATRVIDILHTPPKTYNINRTSWIYNDIIEVYEDKYGEHISKSSLKRIIKRTHYTWRHARQVLTSHDPDYQGKVQVVLSTLRNTKESEAFFFIDELGPYQVKKYGGKILIGKNQAPDPQAKKVSKGKIHAIAALEAFTNQITWKFIQNKGADMVVSIFEMLRIQYSHKKVLFVTWDAISTHNASTVKAWVKKNNLKAEQTSVGPEFVVVPLPSKSQFLNVIESVFSGMSRAVIHNSDYASKEEMEAAIDRHFVERNKFYEENPKRAGNKIWDKEAFDTMKLHGGLFKKM